MLREKSDTSMQLLDVDLLRTLFRGLEAWRAAYVDYGIDVIRWGCREYHILDIERIYEVSQCDLAPRQAQAIEHFLVGNLREVDVSEIMGIAPSNPIGMYATDGLVRLIEMVQDRVIF